MLSSVLMTSLNSTSVTVCLLLVKTGPVPFPRRHFYFPLAPERVKLHILVLRCLFLDSRASDRVLVIFLKCSIQQ